MLFGKLGLGFFEKLSMISIMIKKSALIIEVERGAQVPEHFLNIIQFEYVQKMYLRDIPPDFRSGLFDFVIYACDCINEHQLRWILPLAHRNQRSHYLILANQISIHAYKKVSVMENVVTLQMPLADDVLLGMILQLSGQQLLEAKSRFPRFITDEPVRMVVMETGLLIPSRMRNYSMSGAFIEYKGINLRVGNNLKVNLPKQEDPESKKSLQLDGRVVWVRLDQTRSGTSEGIGVQFIEWVA